MARKNHLSKMVYGAFIFIAACLLLFLGAIIINAKNQSKIGLEKAKTIALKDAKLKEKEVTFVKAKMDKEDGRDVYDVEFYKGNKEYDYEIDAHTGKILDKDMDIEGYSIPKTKTDNNKKFIGVKKAKIIALKDAKLKEKEVTFVKAKMDKEDGRDVYDVEFYKGNKEYDYEIDALTGKILDKDMDIENYKIKKDNKKGTISEEEAKKIALNHAKVTDAHFLKVSVDHENGREVYDIEFKAKGNEYNYEIDCKTGKILNYEMEKDD